MLDIIDEDDGWLLLEQKSINERTLICYYNPNDSCTSIMLFHLTDQPNKMSRSGIESTWGYPTFAVSNIYTLKEAGEVVSLYLQDIEKENFWWEEDR